MSEVKARLIGVITVMDEVGAQRLWEIVERLYSSDGWEGVGEEAPDEVDLQMIREAQTDPDCAIFASDDEVKAALG